MERANGLVGDRLAMTPLKDPIGSWAKSGSNNIRKEPAVQHRTVFSSATLLLFLAFAVSISESTQAEGPAAPPSEAGRVVAGLGNTQQLFDDLEYMVVKLAGRETVWVNNIFPNLDIFVIGVSDDRPVRFDLVIDPAHGRRVQGIIPVADLRDFLDDNLDPIGIVPRRDRGDRNLYRLSGEVYDGWMRYFESYAIFFPDEAFPSPDLLPKDLSGLLKQHDRVAADGYTAFAHLVNESGSVEGRKSAFNKIRSSALEKVKKKPEESQETFDLREAWITQQLQLLEQWFSEAAEIKGGLAVDREKGLANSSLHFAALPGTPLAENINQVSQQASRFQTVDAPEDAVLKLRVNFPIDQERIQGYREIYRLTRPVLKERIQEGQHGTDAEKQARGEIVDLMLDVFDQSADFGRIDLMLNIFPTGDAHSIVLGVRATGQEKITEIVNKLPAAVEGWSVENAIAEAGGVTIHKVSLGEDVPTSISDFYGNSAVVYLAAGDEEFWLSGGENGLENLQATLATVQSAGDVASNDELLSMTMKVGPILETLHRYSQEDDRKLLDPLQEREGLFRSRPEGADEEESENDRPTSRTRSALQGFEWQQTAIDALKGHDDRVFVLVKKTEENVVSAPGRAHVGLLRAVGALIAKFAEENL
jgi:hypothetical protein